jgi:mono/diheme cytochrome c family protein
MNASNRKNAAVISCGALSAAALLAVSASMPSAQTATTASRLAGQNAYRKQCAECHGEKGEGSKRYQHALAGNRTVASLAAYISKAMPPPPAKQRCTSADARLIAGYIYDAFYSPIAQARSQPARFSLSRLTVRQYRNSITDLLNSFGGQASGEPKEYGLKAEYYKTGRPNGGARVIERVDPEVHYAYGAGTPAPAVTDPYQFSMRWQGSVYAPDTGEYDFVLHSEHAVQLWVNDERTPLIDAEVKSGDRTEYHGTRYLLGGRWYPISLLFEKGVTGVDNLEKVKKKPPVPASISLEWQRPKMPVEVIPQRCLTPRWSPAVYVPSAPFPPDDRSIGYERGTSVTRAWEEAETGTALDTAGYVTSHLQQLSGVADNAPDREAKLKEFAARFVERAFRRPLTPDVKEKYVDRQFLPGQDPALSVKRVVILVLKSPRFLYTDLVAPGTAPDAFDVANRLSYTLIDSPPDRELLRAAAAGELMKEDLVQRQAERLVADPRAWAKVREFFLLWFKVDQVPDLAKDPKQYPGFDAKVASDLRTSFELGLKQIAFGEQTGYKDLFLTRKIFLNGRLAKIYGADLPENAPFQEVDTNPNDRCGMLTHPYVMSAFAYLKGSSPIHRGVLIYRNILGRILEPPPAAFAPLAADVHPDFTTRQRVEFQTKPAFCNGCHSLINPVGYTLEKYDAIGRVRTADNGKPVDCTGEYVTSTGERVKFNGPEALEKYISESPEAHRAFVEKLFQFLVKQPIRAYGKQMLPEMVQAFDASGGSIRGLVVRTAVQTSLKR